MRRLLAGEFETFSMEKRYIRKDGLLIWVQLTVSLLRDAHGVPSISSRSCRIFKAGRKRRRNCSGLRMIWSGVSRHEPELADSARTATRAPLATDLNLAEHRDSPSSSLRTCMIIWRSCWF